MNPAFKNGKYIFNTDEKLNVSIIYPLHNQLKSVFEINVQEEHPAL